MKDAPCTTARNVLSLSRLPVVMEPKQPDRNCQTATKFYDPIHECKSVATLLQRHEPVIYSHRFANTARRIQHYSPV